MNDITQLTRVKPALGRIVVEPVETEERAAFGIILPYGKEVSTNCGRVVEVCEPYASASDDTDGGSGPLFKLGDIVVFGKYTGSDITVGRRGATRKLIVMNESAVLCTLCEEIPSSPDIIPIHSD